MCGGGSSLLFKHIWVNNENTFCLYNFIKILLWRCPWCSSYRRRKWTQRLEFKSWTRLITFHIALISLGKVWIQLFSLQLWVNSWVDWFFSLGEATSLGEGKLCIQTCKLRLKIDFVSYSARAVGLVNMIKILSNFLISVLVLRGNW